MEEKKTIKISLSTFIIVILVIILIIMGIYMFINFKEKNNVEQKNEKLQQELNTLKNAEQGKDKIQEELNTLKDTEQENDKQADKNIDVNKYNFSKNEVKDSLSNYLDIVGTKHGEVVLILSEIGLISEEENYDIASSDCIEMEQYHWYKTNIKYSDFKNKMLNYITSDFFEKEYVKDYKNVDGKLFVKSFDGSGDGYEVKAITKISDNKYKAQIQNHGYLELITDEIQFEIENYNGKCVINDCSIK